MAVVAQRRWQAVRHGAIYPLTLTALEGSTRLTIYLLRNVREPAGALNLDKSPTLIELSAGAGAEAAFYYGA